MSEYNPVLAAAARVASAIRLKKGPEAIAEARRDLATVKLDRAVHEALDNPHPPSAEDRAALAALLSGGAK